MAVKVKSFAEGLLKKEMKTEVEAEKVVSELKEKMSRIKFRLLDVQNQNQMLRKELLQLKKSMNEERIQETDEDIKALLNQAAGFKGRSEKILLLKTKLAGLQNKIQELEPKISPKGSADDFGHKEDLQSKSDKLIIDKEAQYVLENATQNKRKLEVWKRKNSELTKDTEYLRLELERLLQKSREDHDIRESYPTIEKQLRALQVERVDMSNRMDTALDRNKQLSGEVMSLKEEMSMLVSKTEDDRTLIEALNSQQEFLQDLLDRQRMLRERQSRQFREALREFQAKHAVNRNVVSNLQSLMEDKESKSVPLQDDMPMKDFARNWDEEDALQSEVESVPEEASATAQDDEIVQSEASNSEAEDEVSKIKEDIYKSRSAFQSSRDELDFLSKTAIKNNEKLYEWMLNLVKTRSLLYVASAEVYELEEATRRLQAPTKQSASPSILTEEAAVMCDVLNEEYCFLSGVLDLLLRMKNINIEMYFVCLDRSQRLFVRKMNAVKPSYLETVVLGDLSEQETIKSTES